MELRSYYVDVKSIPIPEFLSALTYWGELSGDRIAPAWSEISLMEFDMTLIPYINVFDMAKDRSKTRYRFWGTGLTTVFGEDFTNRSSEELPAEKLGRHAASGFEKLVKEKVPNCEVREYLQPSGFVGRQIVLRLPLSDDGKNINHGIALHFHEFKDPNETIKSFYGEIFDKDGQHDAKL